MHKQIQDIIIVVIKDSCKSAFNGIKGRLMLLYIKHSLKKDINNRIVHKYGNQVYYNDLDRFFTNKNTIESIINACLNVNVFENNSQSKIINYYISLFLDIHPQYTVYKQEIYNLIIEFYQVVFNRLNSINDDSIRSLCKIFEQSIGELSISIEGINDNLKKLISKVDKLLSQTEEKLSFSTEAYYKYLLDESNYQTSDYFIPRHLIDEHNQIIEDTILSIILNTRRVLLMGEAGFGKTKECFNMINKAVTSSSTHYCLPIYLSLSDYGELYSCIEDGIANRIKSFCEGNPDIITRELLKSNELLLILDGIDDITSSQLRNRLIRELNDFSFKNCNVRIIATTRPYEYSKDLSQFTPYTLSKIDKSTIRRIFDREHITTTIPKEYFELFSNPLFLKIGITILKKGNPVTPVFNRSELFNQLFIQMYGKEGRYDAIPITYSEAMAILGQFAYNNFEHSHFSYLQLENEFEDLVTSNKKAVISSFLASGIFNISDGITFSHKLFKEFFTAYYLIKTFPLGNNRPLYETLIKNESWKEVFIFACGLSDQSEDQNAILDFVMGNNLPLYIECVNSKFELCDSMQDNNAIAYSVLSEIIKTYTYILGRYFEPIIDLFCPTNSSVFPGYKIGIIGYMQNNNLNYWINLVPIDNPTVQVISDSNKDLYLETSRKIANAQGRSLIFCNRLLSRDGTLYTSGRTIGIELIRIELKRIIENKQLIESKYLLCERITNACNHINELQNMNGLNNMLDTIDRMIYQIKLINPDSTEITKNGIDLLKLQSMIQQLVNSNTVFSECILPGPDLSPNETTNKYRWGAYSKEQTIKLVSDFFYFHDDCLKEMVLLNFPNLKDYIFLDWGIPYQCNGIIDFHDDVDKEDSNSCPTVSYYRLAVNNQSTPYPIINEGITDERSETVNNILREIQDSYSQLGRTSHMATLHITNLTHFLYSVTSNSEDPLSTFVYESIEKSINVILGGL